MMGIAMIGYGAVGQYVAQAIEREPTMQLDAVILRPGRTVANAPFCIVHHVRDLPDSVTVVVDCAGHSGLVEHGCHSLQRGYRLLTVSVGALADDTLRQSLRDQAAQHATQLQVVSGAVGALDALSAARAGGLRSVLYRGIKPPVGWLGSPAEERLDLANLKTASTHFRGTARDAALAYPKNANVAAAIALAGAGFDETQVELIADPRAHLNRHEINVSGEFGRFSFVIDGQALPDNPKSSALTAMSVVSALGRLNAAIVV